MDFNPSKRSQEYLLRLKEFMQVEVYPIEKSYLKHHQQNNSHPSWKEWIEYPGATEIKSLSLIHI